MKTFRSGYYFSLLLEGRTTAPAKGGRSRLPAGWGTSCGRTGQLLLSSRFRLHPSLNAAKSLRMQHAVPTLTVWCGYYAAR